MARGKNKLQKKERVASKAPLPISIPIPSSSSSSSNPHSHHRSSSSINYQPSNQTKLESLHAKARKELISSSAQALKAAQEATEVLSASVTSKGTTQVTKNSNFNSDSTPDARGRSGNPTSPAGNPVKNPSSNPSSRVGRMNQDGDADSLLDEDEFNHTGEDDCDHTSLSPIRMKKAASLLSDLFSSSFRVAVPCLYRGLVQKFQDQVLKERILRFIDEGASPEFILKQSSSPVTREMIASELLQACSTELADVVLRLSTEDTFDLLCDLSIRHNRDLKTFGPPCVCSFSRCLPCLERLVSSIKSTPQSKPPDIKKVKLKEMEVWMEEYWEEEEWEDDEEDDTHSPERGSNRPSDRRKLEWKENWNQSCDLKDKDQAASKISKKKDLPWKDAILGAWEQMAETLWETASSIDPLKLPRIKSALEALKSIDGLDLYYTIATREVCSVDSRNPTRGVSSITKPLSNPRDMVKYFTPPIPKEVQEASEKGITFSGLALDLMILKDAVDKKAKEGGDKKGEKEKEVDFTGTQQRKALAKAIREQGNAAYSRNHFLTAVEHYTRAIGFDSTEPIYPLNRAACLLKLKRYAEGEKDCSSALMLDETNYKAHFRRGVCRAGLGKKEEAKEDFETVLRMQQGNPQAQEELRKLSAQFLDNSLKVQNILASREAQFQSQAQQTKKSTSNTPTKPLQNVQQSKNAPASNANVTSSPPAISKGKAKQKEMVAMCSPDSSPETSTRRLPNSRPSSPLFQFSASNAQAPVKATFSGGEGGTLAASDSEEEEEAVNEEEIDSESWESGSDVSRAAGNTNGTEGTATSNDSAGGNLKVQSKQQSTKTAGISLSEALSFIKPYASGKRPFPPAREVLESKPESVRKSEEFLKDWREMELHEKSVIKIRSAHPEEWLRIPDDLMEAMPSKDQSKFDVMVNSITHSNLSFQDIQSLIFKTLSSESPHALQAIEEAVKRAVEKHRVAQIQLGFAMAFSTIVAKKTGSMKAFDPFKKAGWKTPTKQEIESSKGLWFEQSWKQGMVRNILE